MHSAIRLLGGLLLIIGVFGASVHYAAADDTHWPYPTNDDLASAYESTVGEDALLFGEVHSIDTTENTATITVEHSTGEFSLRVRNFHTEVEPGGTIQVYGILQPDHTIDARSAVVVNPAGSSTTYKYAVSAVGALLILLVFFRQWQFDRDTLGFVPRGD